MQAKIWILTGVAAVLAFAHCADKKVLPTEQIPTGATKIAASTQRDGNAANGYQYLTEGNFLSSGIPFNLFRLQGTSTDDLGRTGDNRGVSFAYNVVAAPNGVKVAVPTCLTCHCERLNGQLIVGLGSNTNDYSVDQTAQLNTIENAIKSFYGANSREWQAYEPFNKGFKAIAPYTITRVRGINPADRIFGVLSAHRNAANLTWLDNPAFQLGGECIPSDVPAWWLMKRKNALYYNGLGVGDFGRLSMASALSTFKDSSEARAIDNQFADVMAYIRTINAPRYPFPIDQTLVAKGETIYKSNCQNCHGNSSVYPNYWIAHEQIGTDRALADEYPSYPDYHNWYNNSWFAQGSAKAQLLPNKGYVAPPLDGIWATAPYLHNGSVPTLDDLLNSTQRPKYWRRSFDNSDYNQQKIGWNYETLTNKPDIKTYDTTLRGYTNVGHTYGDGLTDDERKALLEYLKTL